MKSIGSKRLARRFRHYAGVSCLALLPVMAMPAMAEDIEKGASDTVEVVVTAQKRSQRLIDVPMGITAITGDDLEKRGISSVQDMSFQVPGLTMREDGPGSYTVFVRGLANQSGSGALVSMYLDEAPLSLSGYDQLSPSALDLARVEVLKGPQGTLYGQGSAGGTIRYITKAPVMNSYSGRVDGDIYTVADGAMGTKFTGVINVPIVEDKLALRVAATREDGGGWIDQPEANIEDGNGTELSVIRASLLWQPTERFEAKLMTQFHRAETRLGTGFEDPDRTVTIAIDPATVMIPKKFDFNIYNLEMRYDLGFAELVSATTYASHDHQYPFTYMAYPGNFSYGITEGNDDRYVDAKQMTQELRLSASGEAFEWTVGAYLSDSERSMMSLYEYIYAPDGDLSEGGGALYDGLYYLSESSSKSYSIFADASYKLTDRLTLGGGVRYFHDEQTSLIEYVQGTGEELSETFQSIDPRLYLSYRYASRSNLYASVAKGFRSGGFNSAPFDNYDPEKVYTYEIGTKGLVLDNRLQFDVAAFFTKYEDMVRRRLVLVEGAYLSESSNIGEVEVKGMELGLSYRITPKLTLSANAAYLDSVIVATDPGDQVNIVGDRVDYTPELSYTLAADYDFNWSPDVPGFARIDYSYRDEVSYIDRSSFEAGILPQYSDKLDLVNARIGATLRHVEVELYATNLLDTNKYIDPYYRWGNANRTRPRVIGVKVGYIF